MYLRKLKLKAHIKSLSHSHELRHSRISNNITKYGMKIKQTQSKTLWRMENIYCAWNANTLHTNTLFTNIYVQQMYKCKIQHCLWWITDLNNKALTPINMTSYRWVRASAMELGLSCTNPSICYNRAEIIPILTASEHFWSSSGPLWCVYRDMICLHECGFPTQRASNTLYFLCC